jgi:hypothetical protein
MRGQGIPNVVAEIKGKMSALNYCLLSCRKNGLGCALDCGLRRRWKIPPHGDKYYE